MSVWRRFQRVGKKAAKFQFTVSYTELIIETNSFKPSNIIITCMRRSRKYDAESVKLMEVKQNSSCYSYVWEVPRNEDIVTTLYKVKKDEDYDEKDWTFQLEDVGDNGSHRRLLAFRNLNVAQYAHMLPTQDDVKVSFKMSSTKIKHATLFMTLRGVLLKEGDATDEDMISIASFMSIRSNQMFSSDHDPESSRLNEMDDPFNSDRNQNFGDTFDELGNNVELALTQSKDAAKPDCDSAVSLRRSKTNTTNDEDDRLSNIAEEDRSPETDKNSTADLLEWSKFITCGYKNIIITNFTTSFRNGIAFCAIIHNFYPDLIDFASLKPSNVKENNRIAFTAAETLGIPKLLDSNEMSIRKVPDSLTIMTYLHQLRTQFTDNNLVITPASIGYNSSHNYSKQTTPKVPTSPFGAAEFAEFFPTTLSPVVEDVDADSNSTQSQLGDDGSTRLPQEDEVQIIQDEDINILPPSDQPDTVIHKKGMEKKGRLKLSSLNVDGSTKEECSWSDKKMNSNAFSTGKISTSEEMEPQILAGKFVTVDCGKREDSYILAETLALEEEQEKIDEEASQLETQLRLVLNKDKRKESILLAKWFVLVNKKNALIRRNMQLQILDKEQDLERKWRLLQEELSQINAIEYGSKSEEMKRREDLLMRDLVCLIGQRDKVVKDLDTCEQGMADYIECPKVLSDKPPNGKFPWRTEGAPLPDPKCTVQ